MTAHAVAQRGGYHWLMGLGYATGSFVLGVAWAFAIGGWGALVYMAEHASFWVILLAHLVSATVYMVLALAFPSKISHGRHER